MSASSGFGGPEGDGLLAEGLGDGLAELLAGVGEAGPVGLALLDEGLVDAGPGCVAVAAGSLPVDAASVQPVSPPRASPEAPRRS
ncbi:hypothetical protein [uncultured Friedmanniella sp.]|uniref:hypothetical protein n=1 Tax=uncultured Friedmanniella sp. TaxID=335381 RepID=UPI0035CC7619